MKVVLVLAVLFLIISLVLSVFFPIATGVTPNLEWERSLPGSIGYSVLQNNDGGFTIAGSNPPNTVLIRTTSDGNTLWTKSYELKGTNTTLQYLVQTRDGGYALGGTLNNEYVILKVDSNGNIQWNRSYIYEAPYNSFRDLTQTSDGGYAFVGTFSPPQNSSHAVGQIWFVKTDASGNMEWNKTIVGPQGDFANSIVQNSDGGYAIFCTSWQSETLPSAFKIIKTDSEGNEQWNRTYGGTGKFFTAESDAGILTADGGYLLAGVSVEKDSNWLAWLVKTDSQGNMLWNQNYGGIGSWALSVIQSSDSSYCFGGVYNGKGVWLVKTDSNGEMEWNETFSTASIWGSSIEDFGKPLIQTRDGGYVLVGSLNSQIWIAKISSSNVSSVSFPLFVIVAVIIAAIIVIAAILVLLRRRKRVLQKH